MKYIGTNKHENENMFKCPECGRVVAGTETCCPPAPFDDHLEAMTAEEYKQHCARAKAAR